MSKPEAVAQVGDDELTPGTTPQSTETEVEATSQEADPNAPQPLGTYFKHALRIVITLPSSDPAEDSPVMTNPILSKPFSSKNNGFLKEFVNAYIQHFGGLFKTPALIIGDVNAAKDKLLDNLSRAGVTQTMSTVAEKCAESNTEEDKSYTATTRLLGEHVNFGLSLLDSETASEDSGTSETTFITTLQFTFANFGTLKDGISGITNIIKSVGNFTDSEDLPTVGLMFVLPDTAFALENNRQAFEYLLSQESVACDTVGNLCADPKARSEFSEALEPVFALSNDEEVLDLAGMTKASQHQGAWLIGTVFQADEGEADEG